MSHSKVFDCKHALTIIIVSFPAKSDLEGSHSASVSKTSKTFDVLSSEWSVKDNGKNNCTAVLAGTNDFHDPLNHTTAWLVGQPLYQGHYIDHDISGTLGFADLVDPSNVSDA